MDVHVLGRRWYNRMNFLKCKHVPLGMFFLLICVFCNVASAQASDQPYWRPDPADQRYARDIMDLTYFGRSKFQRHARQRSSRRRQGGGGSHVDDEWRRLGE